MHDVLLTQDPAIAGKVYNDLPYYESVATLAKNINVRFKNQGGRLILFLDKLYHLTGDEHE